MATRVAVAMAVARAARAVSKLTGVIAFVVYLAYANVYGRPG